MYEIRITIAAETLADATTFADSLTEYEGVTNPGVRPITPCEHEGPEGRDCDQPGYITWLMPDSDSYDAIFFVCQTHSDEFASDKEYSEGWVPRIA